MSMKGFEHRFNQVVVELRGLKAQQKEDFNFSCLMMRDMSQQMREMAERMNQLEGRERLKEQRFDQMLDAVDRAIGLLREEGQDWRAAIESRLEKLERERPPAA